MKNFVLALSLVFVAVNVAANQPSQPESEVKPVTFVEKYGKLRNYDKKFTGSREDQKVKGFNGESRYITG